MTFPAAGLEPADQWIASRVEEARVILATPDRWRRSLVDLAQRVVDDHPEHPERVRLLPAWYVAALYSTTRRTCCVSNEA